jgi:PAS domain S-box-containing protein
MYEPRVGDTGDKTVVVVMMDITEQKQAEEAIRESEERYRRLVDVLPAAVFIHVDSKIVFCNPAYVALMGANSIEDLLGKNPYDFVHPNHHAQVGARMKEMEASGRPMPGIEIHVLRTDGRTVPVYSVATPLTYRGRPAYLIALSDLTERERSTELLRSVLGSVSDAILTIDEQGTVQSANPATERLFGYSLAEVVGENVKMLMPDPFHGGHDGYLADYIRTGAAKVIGIGREVEGRRKDESRFPADLTVTEFRLDGQRRFTGVVRDITPRKQSEEALISSQRRLQRSSLPWGLPTTKSWASTGSATTSSSSSVTSPTLSASRTGGWETFTLRIVGM